VIVLLKVVATIAGVVVWDWLGATRLGAYATRFDYRYWPLSRSRIVSIILLAGTIAAIAVFMHPDPVNPPIWPVVAGGAAFTVWGIVVSLDWFAQRREAHREPSRYSGRR